MTEWHVELWQPLGSAITALPGATNRVLTLSVDEGDTFAFSLNGEDESAKLINQMFTDVVVYCLGAKVFRGRIVTANHDGGPDGSTVTYNAVDYKTLLKRRFTIFPATVSGDLEALSWACIDYTQTRRARISDLGITRGENQSTGITMPAHARNVGASMKDIIDQYAQTNSSAGGSGAFEWSIDPELVFRVYNPTRGKRSATFLCDFGGSVLSYDSSFDPNSYANYFFVQGAGTYSHELTTEEGNRPPPGGWFEEYVTDSSLTSLSLVDSRAFWLATYNGQMDLCASYNLELTPFAWSGPDDLWIGDFVRLVINDGALSVDTSSLRVRNMHIEINDDGSERVGVEVGFASPAKHRDFGRMSAFMLKTRRDVLANRARYYQHHGAKLRNAVFAAQKKYGSQSYQYKAALQRYRDLLNQVRAWQKSPR